MDWNELLANVLMAAMTVAVPVLTKFVIDFLLAKVAEAKARAESLRPGLVEAVELAAEYGVKVAEQMGLTGQLEGIWNSKKDCALDKGREWLSANGYQKFDILMLSDMIEKAVLEYFPKI